MSYRTCSRYAAAANYLHRKTRNVIRPIPPPDLPLRDGTLRCRICGSEMIVKRGEVELYCAYALPICDCDACGCRFARHDSSVYELL
jgi:hypothetical protein